MATIGVGVGDIGKCSKLAVEAYIALKSAPKEFEGLRLEVLSLNATLKNLADEATSPHSVIGAATPQKQESLRILVENCTSGLSQLAGFLHKNPNVKKGKIDRIVFATKSATQAIQNIRDKLAIHTASINIFLTSLTHASLGRLELSVKKALRFPRGSQGVSSASTPRGQDQTADDGFNGAWISIGQDLALENVTGAQIERFEQEIKAYVRHLVRGGEPYWKAEPKPVRGEPRSADPRAELVERLMVKSEQSKKKGKAAEERLKEELSKDAYSSRELKVVRPKGRDSKEADAVEELVKLADNIFEIDEGLFATETVDSHAWAFRKDSLQEQDEDWYEEKWPSHTPVSEMATQEDEGSSGVDQSADNELRAAAIQKATNQLKRYIQKRREAKCSGDRERALDLQEHAIPEAVSRLRGLGVKVSVTCDNCEDPIIGAYVHCDTCDEGDWDVCSSCVDEGVFCTGRGHHLVTRVVSL